MISVIVPLYNKEHHIEKSINSIINQTYSNFEVIIIDDGSSDNSLNIIRTIVDARIKIITQPNAGVSAARNRGINESKGEYITFLDADDLWEKIIWKLKSNSPSTIQVVTYLQPTTNLGNQMAKNFNLLYKICHLIPPMVFLTIILQLHLTLIHQLHQYPY